MATGPERRIFYLTERRLLRDFVIFLYQQFTYGVVSERGRCGKFAEILRKFCGNLQKIRFIASGKGVEILRKVWGNSAEIAENFLQ